ncbi:craniofacial development protein 1 [Palaemon carinicauda]|uniref:craniofacial development protein 1 n=1 Tax=Palaemon carinicauda TaxID=392227 RepID=UPI0035B6770C
MLQDDDYESDTSDEDFVPDGAESDHDDLGSENDEPEDFIVNDESQSSKVRKKKVTKKKKNPLLAELEEADETQSIKADSKEDDKTKEVDKAKEDNIWADFLADVDEPPPPPKPKPSSWASLLGNKKASSSSNSVTTTVSAAAPARTQAKVQETPSKSNKVKITKVFEFAGEEVRVEKEVDANSAEAENALVESSSEPVKETGKGMKRPGGFSSILGILDQKKQKLTTLEKTKLDWNNFKAVEGIDEELESHKKSKHGYLEKKDFLERADLRQFEIERAMRMNKRSNR